MIKKLKKRFILIAMLAVTGVMLVLCLTLNILNFVSVNSQLNRTLDSISSNSGSFPPPALDDKKPDQKPDDKQDREKPFMTRYFVLNYDSDGNLSSSNLDNIAAVTESETGEYLSTALKHGEGTGFKNGYKFKITRIGSGYMAVFLDAQMEISSLIKVAIISFSTMLICIILIFIIVVLCSRRAIDPVVKGYEKQKQFITDAGHELKTPITVIATSLKVLEMETGKNKWIDKASSQNEKLKELVNSLVTLSRLDEEQSPLKMKDFQISDAISETVKSFEDFSSVKGHSLSYDIEPELKYFGDEYAIRQLCSILIDNAVKYAAENSSIEISLKRIKKKTILTVTNKCEEELDIKSLDLLFDRFYRADKSRSRETGGFGIGLSIAKSITESHKGKIYAKSPDGYSVSFTAEL